MTISFTRSMCLALVAALAISARGEAQTLTATLARSTTPADPVATTDPAKGSSDPADNGGTGTLTVTDLLQQQSEALRRLALDLETQRDRAAAQDLLIRGLEERLAAAATAAAPQKPVVSPLTIHVGDADFLIGGFMDATAVTRSTNHGSGIATSFGTIPFSNTPQGGLGETRLSSQSSRVTLQATTAVGRASVKGYIEADFLGMGPATLNVTSNPNTLRMRVYWAQISRGKVEFVGGQSWSLLTPNRRGLSPAPPDLFFSQVVDANYQMGVIWSRATQFRFIAHPTSTVAAAISVENPQQYVGSAVVLPAAFAAGEVDATGNTAAPNAYPDVIGKVAFDPTIGTLHQHIDAAFVVRGFKTFNYATSETFQATGTGTAVNAVIEPLRNVRLVGNAFVSNGGGRYIASTNIPDFVIDARQSPSLVASRSFLVGPEVQAGAKTLLFGYRSLVQADQNVTVDTNGKAMGFGVAGSTAANRTIEENTVGIARTFFRDPRIGGVQVMAQYSLLRRTPFSVPSGTPSAASVKMFYVNFRYLLP